MDVTVVENWGDAVMVSVTEALRNFLGFLPALIGAVLVLIIGWIIAGLIGGLAERLLTTIGFERAAQTTGIQRFIERSGSGWTASKIVGEIVKWFIRLIAIQAAASILGMTQISAIINSILLWLPNLVVALAIVVIGALIANFVSSIVRGATSEMGFGNSDLLASVARYAIIAFAVIAAVDQLGIPETVVQTLFQGAVIAVAAALAIAFGLGDQQTAAQITQGWYTKGQEAGRKVGQYAERKQAAPPTAQTPASGQPAGNARRGRSPSGAPEQGRP